MSVTFYGRGVDGERISLDFEEHRAHLNLANRNARAFLEFLGLKPGDDLSGEVGMPEARRAIVRAKATFARQATKFTREGSDTRRSGRCRVVEGGIDADYFVRRLDDFERFVDTMVATGATSIYWV